MALVRRDPFAREELHRERETSDSLALNRDGCSWCGQVKHTKGGRRAPYLYRYWLERDDRNGRRDEIKGLFCSESCRKAYQG